MVEFLIYDQEHWMDRPSKTNPAISGYAFARQQIMTDPRLTVDQRVYNLLLHNKKYGRRGQRGDIIEVRKDGTLRGKLEPVSFAFIQVPIPFEEAKQYAQPLWLNENEKKYRFKYRVNISNIVFDENKTAVLTIEQFMDELKEKT